MWKKAGERGRKWLEWGLAAVVAGVSAASVATHEPYADELHAWLQAREMTVGELWREMACEGHFLPWHLLLHPFARWGVPVEAMGWISWGINLAAVAWLVRKGPFGGWGKAAAALSCVFLYLNPAVSRPYVLVPPVLWGLAALWGRRDERPVAFGAGVALLGNTHLCLAGTAALVALEFACDNVWRRKDGKKWRECRWQLAGLGVMAAGGALALAQVLPSLWLSTLGARALFGWRHGTALLLAPCRGWTGVVLAGTGLAGVCVTAWRRDRGVFRVLAGSLAYLWGFALFAWPATVPNRAALWVPIGLFGAWAVGGGRYSGAAAWLPGLAAAALGIGTMRPELTWRDWTSEYDPLPGMCRWIAGHHGKDAEVWINGGDICAGGASAYLDRVMDWRTGAPAALHSYSTKRVRPEEIPFEAGIERVFLARPEKNGFWVLASLCPWSGLTDEDLKREGVTVELWKPEVLEPGITIGEVLLRVERQRSAR